tara:strand:+ start:101 stop:295 length:195 start_codon:yes stop_codon:yes gene_type:complete
MSASIRKTDQTRVRNGSMSVSEYVQKHGRSPASHAQEAASEAKRNKEKVSRHLTGPPTQKKKYT